MKIALFLLTILSATCVFSQSSKKNNSNKARSALLTDPDIIRLYESSPDYTSGQLRMTLFKNNTVSVSYTPKDIPSDSICFSGVWHIDTLLRLRFHDDLKQKVYSIFTPEKKNSTYKLSIDNKDNIEVIINFKTGDLLVLNDQCQTILKKNNLQHVLVHAEFSGGIGKWQEFLQGSINYSIPLENGAPDGVYKVSVKFQVDENGKVVNVEAENNPGYGCKEEAERVISSSPDWIPASMNGVNVKYHQRQPIVFKVSGDVKSKSSDKKK